MKKLLLITAMITSQINFFGQAVPNGVFESWNSTAYNDANGFNSANLKDLQKIGVASVSKVTGFVGSAVRIQTNVLGADTSDSYIINTNNPCSDPTQWKGGVPYSQQPTAITGYYRYNLPANDSAILIVIFRKNGVHIGDNFIKIHGTGSQNTWTSFSFPVTCAGVPDSMVFAASCSNKISNIGVQNGSFLELDNLGFAGTSQAFPNGTFESWTAKSFDELTGWESIGADVSKSTSSYLGIYAVRMETMYDMCGGVSPSGITNGHNTSNNGPSGGVPYTNMKDTLCGYYKYTSMGNDSATIFVSLIKNGTTVGGGTKELNAAANYTYFEMPFQSGIAPDSMRIDIISSKWPASPANTGSVLYIDNFYLKSIPLGIPEHGALEFKSVPYPNPVKDILSVQFEKTIAPISMLVFDALGKEVAVNGFTTNSNILKLDVANIPAGVYFYEIVTKDGVARNKFVKEK
jgi:hypothetical protein